MDMIKFFKTVLHRLRAWNSKRIESQIDRMVSRLESELEVENTCSVDPYSLLHIGEKDPATYWFYDYTEDAKDTIPRKETPEEIYNVYTQPRRTYWIGDYQREPMIDVLDILKDVQQQQKELTIE